MNTTVFWTVLSGVITFVVGQLVVRLVVEPVQELKKTIAQISHALIQHRSVYQNPGVLGQEVENETSSKLRDLSSQLHAHLFLIPSYSKTARVFCLPPQDRVLEAAKSLDNLSKGVFKATGDSGRLIEHNVKERENICKCLGIYMPDEERWPKG